MARCLYNNQHNQLNKLKYQVVLGDAERDSRTVKVRKFGSQEQVSYSLEEFVELLKQEIASKAR